MKLLLLPCLALLVAAAPPAPDVQAFVQKAGIAAEAQDRKAFEKLYCAKPGPQPNPRIFSSFAQAYGGAPGISGDARAEFSLSLCFDADKSKQRCQVFAVGRKSGKLCLLGPASG